MRSIKGAFVGKKGILIYVVHLLVWKINGNLSAFFISKQPL
jgi:hypothetical protein